MTKYMVLIFGDERQWAAMSPAEKEAVYAGHRAFGAAAGSAILSGEELEPPATSSTLRAPAGGRVKVTDGPFLETKEALGGFYVIEAADRDEVIALASKLAEVSGGHSWVEIRPVVHHG
jgi:hypothetical protein